MAETLLPAVRGRRRLIAGATFMLAAGGSAAATHGVLGAIALGRLTQRGAALLAGLCAALEVVLLVRGRPRPLAVQRQVPQPWGHDRSPSLVALRYGIRLGVGPATILTSWLWWAAAILGAALGPTRSALVGLAFAVSRSVANSVVGMSISDGGAMARRVATVRRFEPSIRKATTALGVVVVGLDMFGALR